MAEAPPPPSRYELEANVDSVCYEVAALERAAELVPMGGRFRFEAFLLHARLLREFLWDKPPARGPGAFNSLSAEHYFDSPATWRGIKGGLPPTLRQTKDRIDRQIAHLARDRLAGFMNLEEKVPHLHAEIMAQWCLFRDTLSPEWAKRFDGSLVERRHELANNVC